MSDNNTSTNWKMDHALNYLYINEVIFVTLVLLCFIGELLSDFTDRMAFFYWLCMTPVFFYCSLLSEKARVKSTGVERVHLIRYELFYWGSAMLAVLLIFMLWHAETIGPNAAGLTIHIILAHTMFLSGIVLGLHYYLVGTFLFLTAFLSIFMGGSFGIDLAMMLPVIWMGFYLEKHFLFPTLKHKHDLLKELDEPYFGEERRKH
jgi:hypothetical protein